MKSNLLAGKSGFSIFLILGILFSSFTSKNIQTDLKFKQESLNDTVPASQLPDSAHKYIEAQFPGGTQGWSMYLMKNVRYPNEAYDKKIQGQVIVKFVVDEKGRLKNLEALSGPKELTKEALRVISNSGKWIPAQENGRVIRSEKEQVITFKREFPDDKKQAVIPDNTAASDSVITTVDKEASYPEGASGWMRYLNRTFRYPEQAQRWGIKGTVVIAFIVDKDGNVSNVEATSGPTGGGLREESERIIRKSGKWVPATLNGVAVKTHKEQKITFMLESY